MKNLAHAIFLAGSAILTTPARAEHWQHVITSGGIIIDIEVDSIRKNNEGAKVAVSAGGANYPMIFDCKRR